MIKFIMILRNYELYTHSFLNQRIDKNMVPYNLKWFYPILFLEIKGKVQFFSEIQILKLSWLMLLCTVSFYRVITQIYNIYIDSIVYCLHLSTNCLICIFLTLYCVMYNRISKCPLTLQLVWKPKMSAFLRIT